MASTTMSIGEEKQQNRPLPSQTPPDTAYPTDRDINFFFFLRFLLWLVVLFPFSSTRTEVKKRIQA
jgi:hypothetical protein